MSNETDRDGSTDRLLRKAFTRTEGGETPGPACVDAEVIAAWVDGALSAPIARNVEHHISICAHCQAVLAALAVTEPEPERAAAAAPVPVVPFWRRWPLQWAAPLAAGAAAVLLWVLLRPPVGSNDGPTSTTMARVEPPPASQTQEAAAPATPAPAPSEPAAPNGGDTFAQSARSREDAFTDRRQQKAAPDATSAQSAAAPTASQTAPESRPVAPASPSVVGGIAAPPPRASVPSAEAASPASAGAMPPAPAPAAAPLPMPPQPPAVAEPMRALETARMESEQRAANAGPSPADQRVLVEFAVAMNETVATGARQGFARATGAGRASSPPQAADAATLVATPIAPPVRWRVLENGVVERQTIGSTMWERVAIPSGMPTSGVAPSPLVCWLAGRDGVVLRATDGRTFTRIAFPEAADLIAVSATSALDARVTTADGRTFTTSDGGATWR